MSEAMSREIAVAVSRDVAQYAQRSQLLDLILDGGQWRFADRDQAVARRFQELLSAANPDAAPVNDPELSGGCLLRQCYPAHLTASALVMTLDFSSVLLLFHKKLGKWLQLGGHLEPGESPAQAALREAEEESGLPRECLLPSRLFGPEHLLDLDVHDIPQSSKEPAHLHFDLRYLFVVNDEDGLQPLQRNVTEADDLRWVKLEDVSQLSQEESVLRMIQKIEVLRRRV